MSFLIKYIKKYYKILLIIIVFVVLVLVVDKSQWFSNTVLDEVKERVAQDMDENKSVKEDLKQELLEIEEELKRLDASKSTNRYYYIEHVLTKYSYLRNSHSQSK